jgi:alpha-tubulin suppressor-like RCC1 family protein
LLERGVVWCWGGNDHGQLGDGTYEESPRPVRVVGLQDPIAIALGDRHSCALERTGRVVCWGGNSEGQLVAGDGVPGNESSANGPRESTRPVPIAGIEAVEIAAGHGHTCARLATGAIACWGEARNGELGGADGDKQSRVPGISDAIAIRAGGSTSCAIRKTGAVVCWGGHWLGGLFSSEQRRRPATEIAPLAGVTELAVGATHACGIRNGVVVCHGQSRLLGDPAVPCCKPATAKPIGLREVTAIAAGSRHTCARRASGVVECWAADRNSLEPMAPAPIAGLADVKQLAAGTSHTCVLRASGEVACWGDDQHGQLGRGVSGRVSRPTRVVDLDDARDLAIGYIHSCALRTNSRVACWPTDPDPLQRGSEYRTTPVDMPFEAASEVSSGIYETCARTGAGVFCVQRGKRGFPPGKLVLPAGTVNFVVSGAGICARTRAGELACVEEASDAHVLPGPLQPRTLSRIAGFSRVTLLGGGDQAICAATATEIACTHHTDHRMRAKQDSPWSKPRVVKGLIGSEVTALAGGGDHHCALHRSGSIACWGAGSRGQLGDGRFTTGDAPVLVKGIADAVELAAGDQHTCARRKDGSLWCWGADEHGQLGDGDRAFESRGEPAKVALDAVLEVDVGAEHSCARTASGVYCWGSNEHGRLGIGVVPHSEIPVTVAR